MDFHSKISPLFLLRKLSQNCVYMSRLSPHSQIHSGWLEIISKLWILKESNKLFTSVTTPGKLEKGKYLRREKIFWKDRHKILYVVTVGVLVAQSCPTLCESMDCSPLGSSVHGTFQARILEWVTMPSSRGSSQDRDQPCVSCIAGGFFTTEPLGKPSEVVSAIK